MSAIETSTTAGSLSDYSLWGRGSETAPNEILGQAPSIRTNLQAGDGSSVLAGEAGRWCRSPTTPVLAAGGTQMRCCRVLMIGVWMLLLAVGGRDAGADEARIRETITALSTHGSRMAGYPGDRFAADLIERELGEAGLAEVYRDSFEVVVPIDKSASLTVVGTAGVAEEVIELLSLWPNLIRTNTLGPDGLESELIYGGSGEYYDFNGFQVEGGVVLMEFNTWKNWKNAAALGVGAIIFIEPEETTLWEARSKWSWAPVNVPRFWLGRPQALALRERLQSGERIRVKLHARMDWESHATWNIWGLVPGTDPELTDEVVVVQTYYDGISVVPKDNPAAESAAGTAAVLELARYLRDHPPGRTVALLLTGSHFLGYQGLTEWFDNHARKVPFFRKRMPQRFIADSLKTDRLIQGTAARGLLPDSLGIRLRESPDTGEHVFESVDMEKLQAQLKLKSFLNADSLGIRLEPDSLAISLFIAVDLSSKSDQVGIVHSARLAAHRRFFVPLGRNFVSYAKAAAPELGRDPSALVNLISPIKGLSWDSYLDRDVFKEDGAIAASMGVMAVNLVTTTDARLGLDSPLDTADKVDFGNIARQSEFINAVLDRAFAAPDLFGPDAVEMRQKHDKNIVDARVAIDGQLRLLPRRSASPDEWVPNGIVVVINSFWDDMWRPSIHLADDEGNYEVNGLRKWKTQVRGFVVDDENGDITFATDMGARAQAINAFELTLTKPLTAWTTVLFPCESMEIHERIHAHFHFPMGNFHTGMKIHDKRSAPPRQFGWVMGDHDEQMMVLYGMTGDSLRLVDDSLLLLNNEGATDEISGQGVGFDLGAQKLLRLTSLQSVRDMWRLDDVRLERMREFAIENPRLDALHQQARRSIERAEKAADDLDWGGYAKYVREALGLEYNAYPGVRGTQNDVIGGLVFFVALLVPAAFFAERLLFAAADIRKQLVYLGLITLVIWTILSQVHPAFQLAHPVIVLLALMVMIMAFFVMSLVVNRFNGFMTQLRQRQTGTDTGDLSRSGTAYVAFMLGISNMRRRVLRTNLTLATITILTFTVLSFTSFKPMIQFIGFEKEWKPPYRGILLHDIHWWSWEPTNFEYLFSHFGEAGTVVPRTWITQGFEGEGYIPIRSGEFEANALGVLGFTVDEPKVTEIDRTLKVGSWFTDEEEKSVILADHMARGLGVSEAEVARGTGPQVAIFGQQWRVIGIFDSRQFEAKFDLNGEPMTPAKMKFEQFNLPGMDQLLFMSDMSFDNDIDLGYEHLPASRLAILPYQRLDSMGSRLISVAVAFDEKIDIKEIIQSYLTRAAFRLFVGMPDEHGVLRTFAYSSIGVTSIEGIGALLVPFLIAALIVLNTMMGAVYERFREIGVYSSVGLAPVHISFLFIAEACVYGVLGVTLGYLLGQVGAKALLVMDALEGISLNYSSTSAITSAVLVMLVVLLSTIYPARVAAQLAVPDVVRRWQLPDPVDDTWQFPFPFTINVNAVESLCGFLYTYLTSYGHESVGKLYTERTRVVVEEVEEQRQYAVQLFLWLAPFDMGVSQYLQFTMVPSQENADIYEIELYVERVSGPVAFWERLNLGFMLDMRKQFLVWQTLKTDFQQEHTDTCRKVAVKMAEMETA
ncbi:MAG: ABC transporter permease [Candidatus Latescibacterota bacterium]|nr:ABC transporter permease [Candidatus Latescibacterota bacterium]